MPRTRSLKWSFWRNERIADLPHWVRLLYQGLWGLADREGRLEDREKRIAIDVFPYERLPVGEGLELLDRSNFIRRYVVGGKGYIEVVDFAEHQRPHPNELCANFPGPNQADTQKSCNSPKGSDESRNSGIQTPFTSVPSFPSGSEEKHVQPIGRTPDRFDEFWAVYPRREAKKDAKRAWAKCRQHATTIIADVIRRAAEHDGWRERRFVPLPASYLNGERWNDAITPIARAGPPQANSRMSGVNALEKLKRGLVDRGNSDGDAETVSPSPAQLTFDG